MSQKKGADQSKKQTRRSRRHTRVASAVTGNRRVAIFPRHAKPYLKRHLGLLVLSLTVALFLLGQLISIYTKTNLGNRNASNFFNSLVGSSSSTSATLTSTYGFSFSYDPQQFYASGVNGQDGSLEVGQQLSTPSPYESFKLSGTAISDSFDQNTVNISYLIAATSVPTTLPAVENQYVATPTSNTPAPTRVSTSTVDVSGKQFQRTIWQQNGSGTLQKQLTSTFISYVTLLNNKPLIIRTNAQFSPASTVSSDIDSLVDTFKFSNTAVGATVSQPVAVAKLASQSLALENSYNFNLVSYTAPTTVTPEKNATTDQLISALYTPAVIKIYNAYCTDVTINGQDMLKSACNALSGSGFFIDGNGNIATNGHIATSNPKDLLLLYSVTEAADGNLQPLQYMAQLGGLTDAELNAITDPDTLIDTICNAVYNLPDSVFGETNNVTNLLVDLSNAEPNVTKLLIDTQNLTSYTGTSNVVHASVIGYNYRQLDGIIKFRDSDVAIIKTSGTSSNYPDVPLGSLSEISSGSDLLILGYPADADDNGLVNDTSDTVTLTTGHVSSIRNALGDSRKLIQTDASIGHGNSGGPVFDDEGHVVGIATYTASGGTDRSGNATVGTFNYARDIADLKTLADSVQVSYGPLSPTQILWQKGVDYFYDSHYSAAIPYFNKVKAAYPQHDTVASFIQNAQQAIKEGENVPIYNMPLIIGGAAAAVILVGVAVFLIIRHHGKHQIYKIATGKTKVEAADGSAPGQLKAVVYSEPTETRQAPVTPAETPAAIPPENSSPSTQTHDSASK